MTILLDFSLVAPGGAATYAVSFLRALADRSDLDDVVVLMSDGSEMVEGFVVPLERSGATVRRCREGTGWGSAMRRQVVVPYHVWACRAGAVFCPREAAPLLCPSRLVVLARNLKVWDRGGAITFSQRARGLARSVLARAAVRRASRVLAVSSALVAALPRNAHAVVVHHGCDLDLVERSRLDDDSAPQQLRVVSLGVIGGHKRFDMVIDAVAALRDRGQPASLAIWGPVGDDVVAQALATHGVLTIGEDPLHGPADNERRQALLAEADVLAMGSSFESFGFPLVEAMRTSTLAWVPASELVDELCDGAAVTHREGSPEAAADALVAALPDAAQYLERGRIRAQAFTWDRTVDQTLQQVRNVLA